MTENHERAEQARFVFHIYGCNVQIVPNATHAIQIIHYLVLEKLYRLYYFVLS